MCELTFNLYLSLFPLDLKVLKEESQELNENEEKYLVDKNPDFIRKKNILAARRLKRLPHEKELRRQELEVSPANTVEKVLLKMKPLKHT